MDYAGAQILLFVSLCQYLMADIGHALLDRSALGVSVHLVLCPTILSGTIALLVKYLVVVRIVPVYKLVSGGLLVLLVSWYIDRICKSDAYLLVRAVGLAIIFCSALGIVVVSEEGFADRHPRVQAEARGQAEAGVLVEAAAAADFVARD